MTIKSDEIPVDKSKLPLVYSCSGCSSAAQMCNHIAVQLDRKGLAEMSCIAGVGGDVRKLVKVVEQADKNGRTIIGVDGCPLACVKNSLAGKGVTPTVWHELSQYEVEKVYGMDYDENEAVKILDMVIDSIPKKSS